MTVQEVNWYVLLYLSSVTKASDFRRMRKVVMVFLDYLFEWGIGRFWSEKMMNLVEVRYMKEFVWWFLVLFSTTWFFLLKKYYCNWGRWVLSLIPASILCSLRMAVLNNLYICSVAWIFNGSLKMLKNSGVGCCQCVGFGFLAGSLKNLVVFAGLWGYADVSIFSLSVPKITLGRNLGRIGIIIML